MCGSGTEGKEGIGVIFKATRLGEFPWAMCVRAEERRTPEAEPRRAPAVRLARWKESTAVTLDKADGKFTGKSLVSWKPREGSGSRRRDWSAQMLLFSGQIV